MGYPPLSGGGLIEAARARKYARAAPESTYPPLSGGGLIEAQACLYNRVDILHVSAAFGRRPH